ncbi:MAG: CvpA family protein [Bacteroidales bacterium]
MTTIDIIIGIVICIGVIMGFRRGFIISIAGLVAMFLGVVGAIKFSLFTSALILKNTTLDPEYVPLVSFVITFAIIALIIFLIFKALRNALRAVKLGFIDRIAGAVFNALKYAFLLSCLIFLLDSYVLEKETSDRYASRTLFYAPVKKIAPSVMPFATKWYEEFKNTFFDKQDDKPTSNGSVACVRDTSTR